MCYEESFYKKSIVPFLNQEIVKGSIFDYIKKAFNITTSFQDRYFNVIKLDEKNAKLLELNVGDPGLVAYNQCFSSSGTVFNYSKIVYHYKNTQFYDQSSTTK